MRPPPAFRTLLALLLTFVATASSSLAQTDTPKPAGPTATLLDGRELPAQGVTFADRQFTFPGDGSQPATVVPAGEVRSLRGALPPKPGKEKLVVLLTGGGRLLATDVAIADDLCTLKTPLVTKIELPIDVLRAIVFVPDNLPPDYHKSLATQSAEEDRAFVQVDKGAETITGLIESLDAKELQFDIAGQSRSLPRAKLLAIVVAQAKALDEPPPCLVTLLDGSRIGGELVSLGDNKLSLRVDGEANVDIPWPVVGNATFRSPRLTFLSDLTPVADEQQPIVTLPRPWQRDRSYLGNPLKVGGRTFEKGIGVHSRSLLTFALDGEYEELAAVVALDDETDGKGDCVCTILADGKPIWTERVKGGEPPRDVKLSVAGARQVTLLVEPGEDLDLADHVDWCDARLIRAPKK